MKRVLKQASIRCLWWKVRRWGSQAARFSRYTVLSLGWGGRYTRDCLLYTSSSGEMEEVAEPCEHCTLSARISRPGMEFASARGLRLRLRSVSYTHLEKLFPQGAQNDRGGQQQLVPCADMDAGGDRKSVV